MAKVIFKCKSTDYALKDASITFVLFYSCAADFINEILIVQSNQQINSAKLNSVVSHLLPHTLAETID